MLKNRPQHALALLAAAVAAIAHPGQSIAQQVLEEVVVTAEKRETSLQDTSISITAYQGEFLRNFEIQEVQDMSVQTPSMAFSRAGGEAQIYLRGVGNNTFGIGVDPSVALHLDGVYLGRAQMGLGQFVDVERVEVLRGPQGTLYGRNATGGTINIISRKPGEQWDGYVRGYYGNFDRADVQGAVGGPVSDRAAVRLAIRGTTDDGFTDDLVPAGGSEIDNQEALVGRATLELEPADSVNVTVIADWTEFYSNNRSIRPRDNTGIAQVLGALPPPDFDETRNNIPTHHDFETGGVTGTVVWDITPKLQLTSVTGYRTFEDDFQFNTDGTEIDVTVTQFERESEQVSQELRLASVGLERWDWMVGLFYYYEDKEEALGLPNRKFLTGGNPPFTVNSFNLFAENETESIAVFGQASYWMTDQIKLTAGLRYTDEEKEDLGSFLFIPNDFSGINNPANTVNPIVARDVTESWDAFTPKFGIDYEHTDDLKFYFTASRGFKSGGTNALSTEPTAFDPEFIWAFEGGLRSTWHDGRLRANLSGFLYDYTDLQVSTFIDGTVRIDNATSADITGVELEMNALLTERLVWNLNVSWLDAEYGEFVTTFAGSSNVVNLEGNTLINAPQWKLNTGASYEHPLANGGTLAFTGQVSFQDEVFFSKENEDILGQEAFTLVDARLAYRHPGDTWEVAAVARNLFDTEYFQNGVRFTSMNAASRDPQNLGHPLGYPGEGRSYGVQVIYNFF